MRGLKRQTGGADGRSNAEGSRRNVLETETRRAELSGRWRAAVSRRQLAAPAPLLSIIHLARAISPTAGAFSLCSLPRLLRWSNSSPARPSRPRVHSPTHPRDFYSLRTIFPAVIPRSCPFCAQLRHAVYSSTREVNGQTSRLVYKEIKEIGAPLREKCADCSGGLKERGQASAALPERADQNELRLQPWAQRLRRCGRVRHA